jgi:hypothetical protein
VRRKELIHCTEEFHKFLVFFYGCETWSLTLREGLRMFENRVLSKMFGPKGEKVAGGWRRLHNEELRNLYVHNVLLG